ncbi:hypothetical protein HNR62_001461 [Oceanisphaera litoralis]|nr:hypothetical protein [Oceanisphaera litoralis]MBM7455589.1 hypothetical protein [Oceanisphaera litoralis]
MIIQLITPKGVMEGIGQVTAGENVYLKVLKQLFLLCLQLRI